MSLFLAAWRASRVLPTPVVRFAAWAVADAAWVAKARPVVRLEENLHRVTGASGRELRRLSRRGMASTARYYAEILEMRRIDGDAIDARVRLEHYERVSEVLAEDRAAVAVLGHSGNWDLVGAYACRNIIPVTAVAERLKPDEVFDEFVALRAGHGLRILGHDGGSTFRQLIRLGRAERTLLCLVADRDLSGSGIEVQMWGHRVKVAPGPAALAAAIGRPILPVHVRYERLRGARRRAARSRWGTVLSFGPPVDPVEFEGESRVEDMTRAWASVLGERIAAHPEDWHMLQRFGWIEEG
ncbi:phosphatidylinositol mannoside acyltransferase [Demequina sp. NBRC 110052]|uniref:phosphatidylinositol mannoside acyltransferase n=1 Tax=Demequina sp. NBRC 110052 TaxID=1570341 RepID=UPI000A06AACA|nr:phosphatidylinositol mannoside acyltransferase [Demequina sp. NBRC 110052]